MSNLDKALKRQNFDWSTSDITGYTLEESQDIAVRSVHMGDTASFVTIQEAVRGDNKIKKFDSTITYQDAACTPSASGDDSFGERLLNPVKLSIVKDFCNNDIAGFYPQLNLPQGAANEMRELPFQDLITNYILEKHSLAYDQMLWQSNKTTGSGNLAKINGFKQKIDGSASVINANSAGTSSITSSTAYTVLKNIARDLPFGIQMDGTGVIFCGLEVYNAMVDQLYSSNNFHVNMANPADRSMTLPGTNVRVVAVAGLSSNSTTGEHGIYAGSTENFIIGTDLVGDLSNAEIMYDQFTDVIRMRIQFYVDVNYAYADQIVKWNLGGS